MVDEAYAVGVEPEAPKRAVNRLWGRVLVVLSILAAAAGLWWALRDMEWRRLAQQVAGMEWRWLALAAFFDVAGYVLQAVRWSLLLTPLGRVGVGRAAEAIYAGLFVNEILPMRVGEVLRGVVVSRHLKLPALQVVPSMVTERLFDGFWLAAAIGCLAPAVPLPAPVWKGFLGLCAVLVAAILVLALWPRARRWLPRLSNGLGFSPWLVSGFVLTCQAMAFWATARACRIEIGLPAGCAAMLIIRLGTMIPNAPANVGSYQFFTVLALTAFGVPREVASPFSVIVFFVLTIPLWAIGLIAIGRLGTGLSEIRRLRRAA